VKTLLPINVLNRKSLYFWKLGKLEAATSLLGAGIRCSPYA
jgi:hypothetical protein